MLMAIQVCLLRLARRVFCFPINALFVPRCSSEFIFLLVVINS